MDSKTRTNLLTSIIIGDGNFHKSCNMFRELQEKNKKRLDLHSSSDVNYSVNKKQSKG